MKERRFSKTKVKVKTRQTPLALGLVRQSHRDKQLKIQHHKCDLCDDRIECNDNIESYIDMMNDVNDSYESEYDKQEPKLLLCLFCQEEFNIPSWV